MGFEGLYDVGNCRSFLSNGHVDAEELLLRISSVEVGLLVNNGVNSDGGLSSLSVTNDELSLATTDGDL